MFESKSTIAGVVGAAFVVFLSGLIDDIRDVSAPAKLAGMVLAGSVLTLSGIDDRELPVPFVGFTVLAPDLAVVASVAWVVGMANAMNLIDGLDGLAAGIIAIARRLVLPLQLRLRHVGVLDPANVGPLIAVIVDRRVPRLPPVELPSGQVFMGDSGALLLGLLLAASTIAVGRPVRRPFTGQSWFFFAPLVIPLVILGVPLFDLVFAVLRRARPAAGVRHRGQGPPAPPADAPGPRPPAHGVDPLGVDRGAVGVSCWCPVVTGRATGLVPILAIAVALLLFTMLMPRVRRRRKAGTARRCGTGPTDADDAVGRPGDAPTPVQLDESTAENVPVGPAGARSAVVRVAPGSQDRAGTGRRLRRRRPPRSRRRPTPGRRRPGRRRGGSVPPGQVVDHLERLRLDRLGVEQRRGRRGSPRRAGRGRAGRTAAAGASVIMLHRLARARSAGGRGGSRRGTGSV